MTGKNCGGIIRKWSVRILLSAGAVCMLLSAAKSGAKTEKDTEGWKKTAAAFLNGGMKQNSFLIQGYVEDGKQSNSLSALCDRLLYRQFPVISYYLENDEKEPEVQDEIMAELFREHEGNDEDFKNIDEESLDYSEDALHIENSMFEEMEKENRRQRSETTETENVVPPEEQEDRISAGYPDFIIPEYPSYSYDWSEKWDYEQVASNFYAVDASTLLKEDYVDPDRLLKEDLSIDKSGEDPQILIYHTHSREAFEDSEEGNAATTIVGAGEHLADILEQEYGFKVLHHTETYDEVREEAYEKALPALEQLLEENPSIEVVIDLHRDEMASDRRLVMDLQGRPTARFMFFNGLSYTRKNGEITYLENPYIQDNLAFSFQAQVAANEYYPGIARKVYLKAYRYNMHLRPKSMLIELGAQNNTVEEIMNACDPLAHILAIVLDEML